MSKYQPRLRASRCPLCGQRQNFQVLYRRNFQPVHINKETFSARRIPDKIHYRFVKCRKDGLVRANPRLEDSSLNKLYTDSRFTYRSETANLTDTYLEVLEPIGKLLDKNSYWLEIGCGNGFMLQAMYRRGWRNFFGVEPSREAVAQSDRQVRKRIIIRPFTSGLWPENKFDCIFFFQTFDHIADPNRFLRECRRLLKPGGYILSFNHDLGAIWVKILKDKSPIVDIEHTFLYDCTTMTQIFVKNGFRIISVKPARNKVSLRHLLWLFPFFSPFKDRLLRSRQKLIQSWLSAKLEIGLGNLFLIAQKPNK